MRLATMLAALLLAPAVAAADPAYLVKDLKTGVAPVDPGLLGAFFGSYTPVGGRVVFFGFLPDGPTLQTVYQCGIWATDGTESGTERLADLCGRSADPGNVTLRMLATNGGLAFFSAPAGRLWRTDGTPEGTFPLGTVQVGPDSSNRPAIGPGGVLFFQGCTPARGCEPWRSDGTPEGTRLIRDLRHGPTSSNPSNFVRDGDRVIFTAAGGLWATDGTAGGTAALAQVGPDDLLFDRPVPYGGRIWFIASPGNIQEGSDQAWVYDPATGKATLLRTFPRYRSETGADFELAGGRLLLREFDIGGQNILWESDGRRAGTRTLGPPSTFAELSPVRAAGSRVVFAAALPGRPGLPRLWAVSPGETRPAPLRGCPGGCPAVDDDLAASLTFAGRLFFVGVDPRHGRELWVTDGTGPGTHLVKDLCPGACDGSPMQLSAVGGRLLFDDLHGKLWTTDGTAEGTVQLADLGYIPQTFAPLDMAPLGGRVVFSGFDAENGFQPWASDLTPAGTDLLARVGPSLAASSWPSGLFPLGGKVLFAACDNDSLALWSSDGTAAETFKLPGSDQQPCLNGATRIFERAGGLAFYAWNGKLWRTDGTAAGTLPLLDLPAASPWLRSRAALGDRFLFVLDPPSSPGRTWSFWTSDGTPAGTRKLFEEAFGGSPGPFTVAGGEAFFFASGANPPYPLQLWRTDGTEAGTRLLLSGLQEVAAGEAPVAVRLGGRTYFILNRRQVGAELWSTDGTAEGTRPVLPSLTGLRPINPFPGLWSLTVFQDALWFFARTSEDGHPWALWRSDGTAEGTRVVKLLDVAPDPATHDVQPFESTVVGNQLFFRLDDGVHGLELWRTDGTAAGTVLVKDIAPGPASSRLDGLTAAGGRLWFGATDGEHGYELWTSDGTAEGTRLVQDIAPGPLGSNPEQLTATGGLLFFSADDGEHGRELWALPLP